MNAVSRIATHPNGSAENKECLIKRFIDEPESSQSVSKQMKSTYNSTKPKPFVLKNKSNELSNDLNDRFENLMDKYVELKAEMLTIFGLQCAKQIIIDENGKPKATMVLVDRSYLFSFVCRHIHMELKIVYG